ncbi:MAG: ExbD/TolR family protein, partial [Bacteroidota bacterium]
MARMTPEINAGSMADIAFLLLIFFLVTTTMDVDTGINRMLPPPIDPDAPEPPPVRERNVFVVLVDAQDRLLVEGERTQIENLREQTKEFLL